MRLKLASWNMAHWSHAKHGEEAWQFFTGELDSEILLFQEAFPTDSVIDSGQCLWRPIGGSRNWGSGIYSGKYHVRRYPVDSNFAGAVEVAEVDISDDFKPIVISLYGLLEKILNTSYAIPNLHRIFSDLTGILEGGDTKHRVILGGDLNASVQVDESISGNPHRVLFDRIREFGLVNCFDRFFDDFVQTHRHGRSDKPWQNDYFFISRKLEKHLVDCRVIDNEAVRKLSDHNPVVIELDV